MKMLSASRNARQERRSNKEILSWIELIIFKKVLFFFTSSSVHGILVIPLIPCQFLAFTYTFKFIIICCESSAK
ncbi:hypothetical protein V1478_000811 [Vespula squamosa]|uniref:Uncharacterized protein n=1 Tax=Vespula squamosa TaxID=30214 RepID=A0ABD2C6K1_VESSQ